MFNFDGQEERPPLLRSSHPYAPPSLPSSSPSIFLIIRYPKTLLCPFSEETLFIKKGASRDMVRCAKGGAYLQNFKHAFSVTNPPALKTQKPARRSRLTANRSIYQLFVPFVNQQPIYRLYQSTTNLPTVSINESINE